MVFGEVRHFFPRNETILKITQRKRTFSGYDVQLLAGLEIDTKCLNV